MFIIDLSINLFYQLKLYLFEFPPFRFTSFIFNQYFGTKFKLLPDHAYLEPDKTGFFKRIDPVVFQV